MKITIDRGNGIEEMDEELLQKRQGAVDDEVEYTTWTEYWLDGQLVHRSAHVTLKQPVTMDSAVGGLG